MSQVGFVFDIRPKTEHTQTKQNEKKKRQITFFHSLFIFLNIVKFRFGCFVRLLAAVCFVFFFFRNNFGANFHSANVEHQRPNTFGTSHFRMHRKPKELSSRIMQITAQLIKMYSVQNCAVLCCVCASFSHSIHVICVAARKFVKWTNTRLHTPI